MSDNKLAPGIHPNMPPEAYFAIDAVSHSTLHLFNKTPAHARERMLHPPEPSEAQDIGTAVHMAVLEPGRFRAEYVELPHVDRRTTVGKATWLDFQQKNAGKAMLSAENMQMVKDMSKSAWAHPRVAQLLNGKGANEVSVVWDLEGEACKARLDRLCTEDGWTVVLDVKTCADASKWGFRKACESFGYYAKAAWYLDGLNALSDRPRKFVLLAMEKEPPYCCALYQFDAAAIELGRTENMIHLHTLQAARASGQWPGYGQDITTLSLSEWKFRALEAVDE